MTEKRFEYIRTEYRHYIQDVEKDGEYREGYRGTYDDFDLDKITDLLNKFNNENEELKKELSELKKDCIKKAKEEIRKQREENAIR